MLLSSSAFKILAICLTFLESFSQGAPFESELVFDSTLVKRNSPLYDLWKSVPGAQAAAGGSAKDFHIAHSVDDAWKITYLYGCTALLISDPNFVIVGHLQEIDGEGCVAINRPAEVQEYIDGPLFDSFLTVLPGPYTQAHILYNKRQTDYTGRGVTALKEALISHDVQVDNVVPIGYSSGGSGAGEPDPRGPSGMAVIQWEAGVEDFTLGTLKVFFGSFAGECPLRYTIFQDGGDQWNSGRY